MFLKTNMKFAVITGATGAIGTALINELIKQNIKVLVLANPDSKRNEQIPKSELVQVVPCGIDEYSSFELALVQGERFDAFYHLAWAGTFGDARNDKALQELNVKYATEAVELAKKLGCKTFVGVGSQAEYGRKECPLTSELECNPENEYGAAKLKAGNETRELAYKLGMKHIWVRVLSAYGPNDGPNTMIMSTISKLQNGEVPKFTPSEQIWDYLFSEDAAAALALLPSMGIDGKTYVLGSGQGRPLKEYIEELRDVVAPNAKLGIGELPYSENQVMHLCADIRELTTETGWTPQTKFKEGIEKILLS